MNSKTLAKLRRWLRDSKEVELVDIMEPVTGRSFKRVIEENIRYVLTREGIRGLSVVIPAGGYDYQLGKSTKFAGAFELFSDPPTIVATGSVIGDGMGNELDYLTLSITSVLGDERPENALRFF